MLCGIKIDKIRHEYMGKIRWRPQQKSGNLLLEKPCGGANGLSHF
jgi:hypothetical protein